MLNTPALSVIIGCALGFLAGLGVGGGSLLILWLTVLVQMPQADARMLNLLFFLPTALISCLFRWRSGSLQLGKLWCAILGGAVGAALCSAISYYLDTALLKKFFGALLLFTGFRELTYRAKKAK